MMIFAFCDRTARKELSQNVTSKLFFETTRKVYAFLSLYMQDCLVMLRRNYDYKFALCGGFHDTVVLF